MYCTCFDGRVSIVSVDTNQWVDETNHEQLIGSTRYLQILCKRNIIALRYSLSGELGGCKKVWHRLVRIITGKGRGIAII